jgi:hypothetical protein
VDVNPHREGAALAASLFVLFTLFGAGMFALGHRDALHTVGVSICGDDEFTYDVDYRPVCHFGNHKN